MTYCFAFSLNPDGLALISDTRITTSTKVYDGQQKVFFPTPYSFLAVSGNIANLEKMLEGLSENIVKVHESQRLDEVARFLDRRCRSMQSFGMSTGQSLDEVGFAIIYGDTRRHRSGSRARLIRFELGLDKEGSPYLDRCVPPNLGWLTIGTTPSTRRFIANTAADSLDELEQRGLSLRTLHEPYALPACAPIHADLTVRGKRQSHERETVMLDSSGPRNGTFRKVLREHYRNLLKSGKIVHQLSPLVVFATAARNAIADQVAEFKSGSGIPDVEGIGDSWCIATISNPEGAQIYTDRDSDHITSAFSLRRHFSMMRPD